MGIARGTGEATKTCAMRTRISIQIRLPLSRSPAVRRTRAGDGGRQRGPLREHWS